MSSINAPVLAPLATADIAMMKAKQGLNAPAAFTGARTFQDVLAEQTGKRSTTLSDRKLAEIDASAQEFEGMFISQMLQPMFETVASDEVFGGGQGEDTWKGMMVEQYGKELAATGGIGLTSSIKEQMIKIQEGSQNQ